MYSLVIIGISLFVVIGIVAVIAKLFLGASGKPSKDISEPESVKPQYKYSQKQFIMTKSENDFYRVLQEAIGTSYMIYPQAHLDLFLDHRVKGQNWRGALSSIQRKSVDFLICNRDYYNPLVAIELDDSSHQQPDRVERDTKVDAICNAANMPLVRMKWQREYNLDELLRQLAPYLR